MSQRELHPADDGDWTWDGLLPAGEATPSAGAPVVRLSVGTAAWPLGDAAPPPVPDEEERVASLGHGWTVTPGPGPWGTVRIDEVAWAGSTGEGLDDPYEEELAGSTGDGLDDPYEEGLAVSGEPEPDPGREEDEGPRDRTRRRTTSDDLTPGLLIRGRHRGPTTGWRGALYRASGRTIDLGESAAQRRTRELVEQVRTPLQGCFRIAVLSLKGGVGKTTTTFCLGATLASLRGDRVLAIDANPDTGTLAEHVVAQTDSTLWDLLAAPDEIASYSEVRRYTSQSPDRLEVLASARDPQLSHAFDAADYRRVLTVAERFYSMTVTDCGTGLLHSAMTGVLGAADRIVLVSSTSFDGARSASATIDWLEAHGHAELAADACVVINASLSRSPEIDLERLEEHFAARVRAVVTVPWDRQLARGTAIELAELDRTTRECWLRVAAAAVGR